MSDSALELCKDSLEAYLLASVVLEHILKTRSALSLQSRELEGKGSIDFVIFH